MEAILLLLVFQGLLGAFDLVYHHEFLERLPWRKTAALELVLHGVRNFFYAIVFASLGFVAWHGAYAWVFAAILLIEVFITLWDFVEEDLSRKLPATERVSHTILALNYGAMLALFMPVWSAWAELPTGFVPHDYGLLSLIMGVYAVGVFLWGIRDLSSGLKLYQQQETIMKNIPELNDARQRILITGGTGFIGRPLAQLLADQGHAVTVSTRSIRRAAELFHGRMAFIEEIDALGVDEAFDVIINLTGEGVAQRWNEASKARILGSRLHTTQTLTRYIERAKTKPKTLIHASAIGIYGLSEEAAFDEDSPLKSQPESFSEEICFAREASTRAIEAMGVRVCQLRIGLVLEKDGGMLSRLLFPFSFGLGGPVGNGRQWMSWIHRDDTIGMIYHIINRDDLAGPFNAVAPQPVRQKDFASALGKAMCRPSFMPLPALPVKALFGRMGEEFLLSGQRVLPTRAQHSGYIFAYSELSDALAAIFPEGKCGMKRACFKKGGQEAEAGVAL